MTRTQIQLKDEQASLLKAVAAESGESIAEVIRNSVELYLDQRGGAHSAERRERALAVAGRFHSGRSDVAEQHDRALAEAFAT